jgi:hypothetical protein
MSYVSRWAKPSSEQTASERSDSKPAVFLNRAADGLVNTSLPAQRAPKLAPTTLAAATLSTATLKPMEASEKYRAYTKPTDEKRRAPIANVESVDEFPSLGKAPQKALPKVGPAMNFASLSRDWAQKQKEDEVKTKEEKEKQRIEDNLLHKERERRSKDDQVLRKTGIVGIRIPSKKTDSDEEKYDDAYKSENSDEPYLSDDQYADDVYEEEEEEEEYDGGWNQRKHRDEMY